MNDMEKYEIDNVLKYYNDCLKEIFFNLKVLEITEDASKIKFDHIFDRINKISEIKSKFEQGGRLDFLLKKILNYYGNYLKKKHNFIESTIISTTKEK